MVHPTVPTDPMKMNLSVVCARLDQLKLQLYATDASPCAGNVVPADRFSCNDSTSCVLPFERVCDGTRDCPNGRDEESCPARE